mgnify:CR=1 FL=1
MAAVLAGFFLATLIWQQRPRAAEPPGSIIVTTEHAEIYGLLARGFLRGQLDLDLVPDPALTAAANPYDPALRPKVWYPHDASLFNGKFYAYFGPAPAVLAYANEVTKDDPRVNLGYALVYPAAMIVKVIAAPFIGRF